MKGTRLVEGRAGYWAMLVSRFVSKKIKLEPLPGTPPIQWDLARAVSWLFYLPKMRVPFSRNSNMEFFQTKVSKETSFLDASD